ncbi:LOW QUALITY PROTEIN: F-box only protein 6-like [Simochromis diagramma]|uniref:LOW QUALITY PROTEIN: F-box only protein 6-like n=1 Tax=Simochromis diagramma TaxID=43689 RepID=UPI001A7EE455|nr:LOW QUALITY PROTEIN: F-box only protein 6-like [Simochromis diagramma]
MDESQSSSDSDQSPPKKSSAAATASDTYLNVLEEIFLNVPPHQVIYVCRLVCSQWKEAADSNSLWKKRCRREGYSTNNVSKKQDWKLFYFLSKKRRNLLKNPNGAGKNPQNKFYLTRWNPALLMCVCTLCSMKTIFVSHRMCIKSQLIDLEKEGYSPSVMDHAQPDIKISDW